MSALRGSWVIGRRTVRRALGVVVVCAIAGMLCAPGSRAATPGTLDPSFGLGGVTYDQFGLSTPPVSAAADTVVAPNGDIYATGGMYGSSASVSEEWVARFTPAGALDPSFGNGGVTIENAGLGTSPQTGFATSLILRIALTPGGDPIVATAATDANGNDEIVAFELTDAGLLNPAFGSGGVYRQQLGSGTSGTSQAIGIATQPDGKIVLTGSLRGTGGNAEFFAERLTASGSLDSSFATAGLYEHQYGQTSTASSCESGSPPTQTLPGSEGTDVIVEPNGDLTFVGGATDTNCFLDAMIIRLTAAGTPDPSFDPGFLAPSPGTSAPAAIALRVRETRTGEYVLAGETTDAAGNEEILATEFTATGALDTTFANAGVYVQQLASGGNASVAAGLAIQPDGKIDLLGGTINEFGIQAAIIRLLPNGNLDSSFGTGGVFEPQIGTGSPATSFTAGGTLEANGDLLFVGESNTATTGEQRAFLAAAVTDTPPTVSVTASPASPQTGQAVTFTATTTPSSGTSIATDAWDLGSGSFTDATGASVTHTFSAPGTYTVRVRATDTDGLSTISSQTVTVTAAPSGTGTTGSGMGSGTGSGTGTTGTGTSTAPKPQLKITALKGSATGVSFKLTCLAAACRGTVKLSAVEHLLNGKLVAITARASKKPKKKTVTVTLGSVSYALAVGKSKTVTIRLNAAGKRLLAQRHTLALALAFTLNGAKPATVATKHLTLKAAAKKPR